MDGLASRHLLYPGGTASVHRICGAGDPGRARKEGIGPACQRRGPVSRITNSDRVARLGMAGFGICLLQPHVFFPMSPLQGFVSKPRVTTTFATECHACGLPIFALTPTSTRT